jgi:hypothetical protein
MVSLAAVVGSVGGNGHGRRRSLPVVMTELIVTAGGDRCW